MSNGFRGVPGVPDGWELVEFRTVRKGDWILSDQGWPMLWQSDGTGDRGGIFAIIRETENRESVEVTDGE